MKYLAQCYSHPDPIVRAERAIDALIIKAMFLERQEPIYSPIAESWATDGLYIPHKKYMVHCKAMLAKCDVMYVLENEENAGSVGLQAELQLAKNLDIPVILVELKEFKTGFMTFEAFPNVFGKIITRRFELIIREVGNHRRVSFNPNRSWFVNIVRTVTGFFERGNNEKL